MYVYIFRTPFLLSMDGAFCAHKDQISVCLNIQIYIIIFITILGILHK